MLESLIKGYENTSFGEKAFQLQGKDAVKNVWVYGLHTESGDEVLKCVKDLAEVQLVQDGLTTKRYHADGAGELTCRHIRKYLHKKESTKTTKVMLTPRSTPETKGLPSLFWYKALLHAVSIINLLPTKTSRGYISPVEFLSGEPADVRDLKIWGWKAWVIVPRNSAVKNGRRRGTQPLGHRIYIPDLDDEIVTVHATFDEQIPPRS